MYDIAVIGDRDSVYAFAALGLHVMPAANREEALSILSRLDLTKYAVVYITEQLASQLEDELKKYDEARVPAIIPIPGISGNTGIGAASVKRCVERAVSSDIIGNAD